MIGPLLNVVGGVALAAFGILVAVVGRARGPALGVGAFAVGLGTIGVSSHLDALVPAWDDALRWVTLAALVPATAGLLVLAATFPQRRSFRDRGVIIPFVLCGSVLAVAGAVVAASFRASGAPPSTWIVALATIPFLAAYGGLLMLLARDHRRGGDLASAALVATVGLLPYVGLSAGNWLLSDVREAPLGAATYVILFAVAVAWLRGTTARPTRAARNIALFALAMPVAAAVAQLVAPEVNGAFVTRLWAVAVLAYGILRHQLLGLDVKVRWTISKSTIAAAFVAAFFVASEGAQLVFGEGNELVGLVAAGALVFAIAPLQRAADRLAERAVPTVGQGQAQGQGGPTGAAPDVVEREDAYRNALRLALRDRVVTRDEEAHLFRLAHALGIDANRAHALLVEVERERDREAA